MNLDRCTPGQREAIETLDAPLMVAAGAGSGKTFTLTQRIVNARCPQGGNVPFLSSVDEVCAITFTRKAAGELRARIKALLIAEGLTEDALRVDNALITTIHGMAARLLRENALAMHLDPEFEVISTALEEELRAEAVERIVKDAACVKDPLLQEVFAKRPLMGVTGEGSGFVGKALSVLSRVKAMPGGFDGLVVGKPTRRPGELMRCLLELGHAFMDVSSTWEKTLASEQKILDALAPAVEGAESWLSSGHSEEGFLDEAFDVDEFCELFYAFPPTSAKFRAKKDDADFFEQYRRTYAELSAEVETGAGCREAAALVRFARLIDERYTQIKGPSRLDNGDLLSLCLKMLSEHPGIARSCRERFKLIMVDEFQDTDKLQVELIRELALPGLANVCVVGDAQQSIYRFRGADVNVFLEYRERLFAENGRARAISLPDNFRSHADVLAFVDAVFSRREMFGGEFLHLEPRGAVNATDDPVFEAMPRISLDLVHHKRAGSNGGVRTADATFVQARRIARHFARLREAGARAGEMALLLGAMKNAGVYARALREAGFESAITGGSVFALTNEARLVGYLLRIAVNLDDEEALFAVLTSALFAVSDDDIASLVVVRDEGGMPRHRSLAAGFLVDDGSSSRALSLARNLLLRFVDEARAGSACEALRSLFLYMGAFDRMAEGGASGLAAAGNIAKALDIVRGFERECTGVSSLCGAYADHLRTSKEAPGGLSTAGSDAVRIMTVHASKGLEFPHIVVADLRDGEVTAPALIVENIGEHTYLGMRAPLEKSCGIVAGKLRSFDCAEDRDDAADLSDEALLRKESCAELFSALDAHYREQERSEAKRLLYVALTRASKSLLLACRLPTRPDDGYVADGLFRELHAALKWETGEGAEPREVHTRCDFGGSAPAQVSLVYLTEPPEEAAIQVEQDEGDSFAVVERRRPAYPMQDSERDDRDDVRSYTSLAQGAKETPAPRRADEALSLFDDTAAGWVPKLPDEDATALGTAFHLLAQQSIELMALAREKSDARLAWCIDDADRAKPRPCEDRLTCGTTPVGTGPCPVRSGGKEPLLGASPAHMYDRPACGTTPVGTGLCPVRSGGEKPLLGASPARMLAAPDSTAVAAKVRALGLSADQASRLERALDRWFSSVPARELAAHRTVEAEVPFMVSLACDDSPDSGELFYLEGEIDALACDDRTRAFFVDYKTGGTDSETPDQLHEKHLLQAQCYAYALFAEGYETVEACFVRVERDDPGNPGEPQCVRYSFAGEDVASLRRIILEAYRASAIREMPGVESYTADGNRGGREDGVSL